MLLSQISKQNFKIFVNAIAIYCIIVIITSTHITYTEAVTRPIDRNAYTIYYKNKPANKTGHYHFEFQTSNGITTKSAGNEYGASGVVQYVSLEGLPITMTYVADSDGYHPQGEHIPKLPQYVTKSSDHTRKHPINDGKKSRRL